MFLGPFLIDLKIHSIHSIVVLNERKTLKLCKNDFLEYFGCLWSLLFPLFSAYDANCARKSYVEVKGKVIENY